MTDRSKVSKNKSRKDHGAVEETKTPHHHFIERLLSSSKQPEFCTDLSHDFLDWFASRKLSEIVIDEAMIRLVLSTLTYDAVHAGMQRFFVPYLKAEVTRLRKSDLRIEHLFSPHAQALLSDLIASPELLSGKWMQKSMQHKAFHELMASLLYHTLWEFNLQVNPFFSSWGLPSLLKKSGPLGMLDPFGVGNRVIDTIKKEFEKQLEPQIKNFLALFTSTALNHVITFVTSEKHRDMFSDLRRDFFRQTLREKCADALGGLTEDRETQLLNTLVEIISHYLCQASTSALFEQEAKRFLSRYADQTVTEFLIGFSLDTPQLFSHLDECIKPILAAYLQSPGFQLFLERHFTTSETQEPGA